MQSDHASIRDVLLRLCEAAAAHGGIVCPHPETIELAWVLRDRVKVADPKVGS